MHDNLRLYSTRLQLLTTHLSSLPIHSRRTEAWLVCLLAEVLVTRTRLDDMLARRGRLRLAAG